MPRRGTVTRREVLPDPVYNSKLVTQVINKVLLDGKKSTAEQIVYGALEIVREKTGRDPVEVMQDAVQALTPHLDGHLIGGAAAPARSPSAGWSASLASVARRSCPSASLPR
jgi:small subunit ribosomal protein S7